MVKTEMGIHCYQKKRKWYWSVQPEESLKDLAEKYTSIREKEYLAWKARLEHEMEKADGK